MATNTEVGVKITVDGGQALSETKKLRDNVEQLKNELRDLVEGSDDYEKKLKEVNDAQKKLEKSNEDTAKGLDKTAKETKKAEGGFKSMGNAIKSLGIITIIIEAFNIFKEALSNCSKI
jgi:chromosome segregation ATPase